jgi:LuxR family maltose regulon positive regulatory protein
VLTALERASPGAGNSRAAEMMRAPQPPPIQAVLAMLLNELASSPNDLVLVLDDYQSVEEPAIHEAMSFLIDHLPPHCHIVLASRSDPPIPVSRLRARGELMELRAADLRFTQEEAADFLGETMGVQLDAELIAALEARTEGWVAALQLAALSLQGRDDTEGFVTAFSGDDRYVVDYLVEEVLERQPPDVRRFLLGTSILDALSAPLCDAVMGGRDARVLLDRLDHDNLFLVPLDARREWYRYHHLFGDVLRTHLAASGEDPEILDLHFRASTWYEEHGRPEAAIRHALAGFDVVRAAELVERQARIAVEHHRPDRLVEWLKPLPQDVVRRMPVLSAYAGHALQGMGHLEASEAHLDDAERLLSGTVDPGEVLVFDEEALASLPSRIALARGYLTMAAYDLDATAEHARTGLALLGPDDHHWRAAGSGLLGLVHWARGELEPAQELHAQGLASFEKAGETGLAITSTYHDADLLKARGRLTEARVRYERGLELAHRTGGEALHLVANLHLGLSELCTERNDFEGAREQLRQAEALGIYPPRTPFRACLTRARLLQSEGDLDAALAQLDEAARLQIRGAVPDVRPVAAWKARVLVRAGRLPEAAAWVRERGLGTGDLPEYLREFEHLTLARVLLARRQGRDLEDLGGLLERLLAAAAAGGRFAADIEGRALEALRLQALGRVDAALAALEPALRLAEPEGYARIFLDEGEPMVTLLAAAAERGITPAYCRQLLGSNTAPAPAAIPHSAGVASDALSERELDVLRLLATDLSGPDIASELVVSLNTLRTHTRHIYEKLGVDSRRAAVSRARELGLI